MMGLGTSNPDRLERERLLGLASILEVSMDHSPPRYEQAVNTAAMIRNMVKKGAHLTTAEKVRLVRSLASVKAKVYAGGTHDSYRIYRKLDSISDELVQLL
jgi:hypothetical protein